MSSLEIWLAQATRKLSRESATQVRSEIEQHYESAREAAMNAGATIEQADQSALAALGDPKAANCQYRRVLLTSSEAAMLRKGNSEANFFCSRPWLKWTLLGIPLTTLLASAFEIRHGRVEAARVMISVGICMSTLFLLPYLPIYTLSRGRIVRAAKWVVVIGMFAIIFGRETLQWSWLLISCVYPVFYVEWTRESIRRKLPVERWPKQLYL